MVKYEEKYLDMMKPNFEKHSNNIILPLLYTASSLLFFFTKLLGTFWQGWEYKGIKKGWTISSLPSPQSTVLIIKVIP